MNKIWHVNDIVRLHLPPENAEPCEGGEEPESDIEEAYIEPPKMENSDGSEPKEDSSSEISDEESDPKEDNSEESPEGSSSSEESDEQSEDSDSSGKESEDNDDSDSEPDGSSNSEGDVDEESEPSESSEEDTSEGSSDSEGDEGSEDRESPSSEGSSKDDGPESEELPEDEDTEEGSSSDVGDTEEESDPSSERSEDEEPSDPVDDAGDDDPVNGKDERDGEHDEDPDGRDGDDTGPDDSGDPDEDVEFEEEEIIPEQDKPDDMTPEERQAMRDALKDAVEATDKGTMDEKHLSEISKEVINELNENIAPDTYSVRPGLTDSIQAVDPMYKDKGERLVGPSLEMLGPLATKLRYLFTSRESQSIQGGMTKGPRLDGRSIHKAVTGKKGRTPPIFSRKQRSKNVDAVVSILVDNSGSMRGEKMRICEKMCIGLGTTLQRMNTPFEMFGFTEHYNSYGVTHAGAYIRTGSVIINKIKEYDERFEAYKALEPPHTSGNADLEVGHILVDRLRQRPEPKKIFFVISDGEPCEYFSGYTNTYKRFLQSTKDEGIHVFGFGIGLAASIERYFGDDSVTIDESNLDIFPTEVIEVLTRILGGS